MNEPALKTTHELLQKLADYVMTKVSTKDEVDQKIVQVDAKIDKLADYMINNLPTREEMDVKLEQKADKKDVNALGGRLDKIEKKVDLIIDGMDGQAQQLDIIRTEQTAFHSGLRRIENRVEKLEKAAH